MYQPLALVLVVSAIFRIAESCSSRSTPKPRAPSPTLRPNVTFQTYACPPTYAAWYCLNGATCFTINIGDSILYNCECADGYMGQRCEFKDLDGSYLPSRERVMLETASIASGATVAVLLVVVVSIASCIYIRRKRKEQALSNLSEEALERRPFSSHKHQVHIRMCTGPTRSPPWSPSHTSCSPHHDPGPPLHLQQPPLQPHQEQPQQEPGLQPKASSHPSVTT